ncbi:hypothetical protein [Mesoterricola silvestris]|uniref:hypothetical protein n=1 Tax=Mesoterricola silvestris TaxID=2927979 RepID=UPI00293150C4|nr:hypothetical protein [Mesoterricola silvestris]
MSMAEPRKTIRPDSKGRNILEPEVEVPGAEAWLWQNPSAIKSVQQGLKDSFEGKLLNPGSFVANTKGE